MKQQYKSYDELPLCMNVKDLAAVMGICTPNAYELANRADFPAVKVSEKRIVIPRDRFLMWLLREDYEAITGKESLDEPTAEANSSPAPLRIAK